MRSLGRVDLAAYGRAFVLLARNPLIALGPLLAGLITVLLFTLAPGGGLLDFDNGGFETLVAQLLSSFGLAVAIILAETAWRRGRAPFDEAWDEARRKAGGILLAALGFNFVVYVAGLVGSFVPVVGSLILTRVAMFFFIYTIPAAAIGGFPGGAALQASLERAQRAPLATLLVTAVYLFSFYAPTLALEGLFHAAPDSPVLQSRFFVSLIVAGVQALATSYVALVLAKAYDDASYGRRY